MSKDNIIEFPNIMKENISGAERIAEDMRLKKVTEVSDYLAENILMAAAKELVAHEIDVQDPQFLKDYAFALEALRSCLYRHGGVEHEMQALVDKYCEFRVIKNDAGEIAQVGLSLLLDELDDDDI